ncbi:MAG: hypothetical protein EU540_04795 [Promethearchaeota archaeon]|nr:MAG: hypothetical protein EU540_04795 [Candidatus Lokiarchaeota archaeon]
MTDEKKKKAVKPVTEVKLRSYPKIIFLWPLLIASAVLWPIQAFSKEPLQWLGIFWLMVLFCNLFVIAFDFSSAKFFILILGIVILVLLLIFWIIPTYGFPELADITWNPGLTANLYMAITLILGIILFFVWLGAQFDYYKLERNEIYHKKGIFADAERFPVKSLRLKKEIPDVFEYFVLRAGSITLLPGRADEVITLHTVLNINKKADQIDFLLSHISVEPDEIDA